jgi:hypothetical protein
MSRSLRLLAITFVVLAVACGGDDDAAPTSAAVPGGNTAAAGDESATASTAGDDQPVGVDEDYPVAVPGGWTIDILGRAGLDVSSQVQVLYPLDEFDEVVAFYDQWTDDQPGDYVRSETATGVIFRLVEPFRQIAVTNDYKEQGEQYTALQIVAPEG